ncbi:MAG: tyrosine--tRNA ligase [Oscillospiraceae bacterium]|nr:tyrosine--tRNA ligase [Oscillospiraceae bacterium]
MTLFQELKARGLIAQVSRPEELEELLNTESVSFYTGFDATADSLHIGGLLQLITMRRFQLAGHKPYALLGTATSLIGDPTGKTELRKMLSHETIAHNCERFAQQMGRILYFDGNANSAAAGIAGDNLPSAEFVRNGDWFADIKYLEFLGAIGRHFSVNKMLTAECFRSRYEGKGLSFLEFNYMLLQSYDFLHLFRTKNIKLQMGGDDQWSNILAGADLIRRMDGEKAEAASGTEAASKAYALTFRLITTSDGMKMGKTEKGALWLAADRCPVYDFYQYFRNVGDADVINLFKWLTFVPVEEIEAMNLDSGAKFNEAKARLAFEMTKIVHGEEEAEKAHSAAKNIFGGGGESADMPTTIIEESEINILDLLVKTGLCSSRRDARTNVEQGGVSLDGEKVTDVNAVIEIKEHVIIKKGKKNFHKAARNG